MPLKKMKRMGAQMQMVQKAKCIVHDAMRMGNLLNPT
jgi:hypothetical protein